MILVDKFIAGIIFTLSVEIIIVAIYSGIKALIYRRKLDDKDQEEPDTKEKDPNENVLPDFLKKEGRDDNRR